jgi:hypothetical protein
MLRHLSIWMWMVLWICHLFAGGSCFILSPTIALHPSIPQSRRALANEVICGSHQRLQLRSRMIVPVLWAAGSEGYSLESIIPVTPEMMSTHTNILGETIITCRDFSVHSEKTVDALGVIRFAKKCQPSNCQRLLLSVNQMWASHPY